MGIINSMFKKKEIEDSITPYVIVSNFENTNERECGKIDSENELTYNKLLKKATKAEKTIENSGLSMNLEVPMPPHPNNRDRFILWKKRNTLKYVIPQSEAVVFLYENGYKLNEHYEAYQAIDLANEIKKKKGLSLNIVDKSKDFNDIYTHKDKNILRRRSMYCHEKIKPIVNDFEERARLHSIDNSYFNSYNNNMNQNNIQNRQTNRTNYYPDLGDIVINEQNTLNHQNMNHQNMNHQNNYNQTINNQTNNHNNSQINCQPSAPPPEQINKNCGIPSAPQKDYELDC